MRRIVSIAAAIFACLFIVSLALGVLSKNQKNERDKMVSQLSTTQTTMATTTNFWEYVESLNTTTAPEPSGLQEVTVPSQTEPPIVTTVPDIEIDFIG